MSVAPLCLTLWELMDCHLCPWNSPGKNTGVCCHFLLWGIFLTQGSNLGLSHCRQIAYHLSHQGSSMVTIDSLLLSWLSRDFFSNFPRYWWKWKSLSCVWLFVTPMDYTVYGILQARILEWVTFPFSRGSTPPRNRTGVSCIAGGFFTDWAVREAFYLLKM